MRSRSICRGSASAEPPDGAERGSRRRIGVVGEVDHQRASYSRDAGGRHRIRISSICWGCRSSSGGADDPLAASRSVRGWWLSTRSISNWRPCGCRPAGRIRNGRTPAVASASDLEAQRQIGRVLCRCEVAFLSPDPAMRHPDRPSPGRLHHPVSSCLNTTIGLVGLAARTCRRFGDHGRDRRTRQMIAKRGAIADPMEICRMLILHQ